MFSITNLYKNSPYLAGELFSAGWCNLDCKYCYIPKNQEMMKTFHSKILDNIKSGQLLKEMQEMFGTKLEWISHWGTEPTLTIELFKEFYLNAIENFPNLKGIKLSSNFMVDPNKLINFIKNLPETKQLQIDIQMSLDGPEQITDKNRRKGSSSQIISNMIYFFELLNNVQTKHKIYICFKSTLAKDDLILFADYNFLKEYYTFFDNLIDELMKRNTHNVAVLDFDIYSTIVLPEKYTSNDGKLFHKMYLNTMLLKEQNFKYVLPESAYYLRFRRLVQYGENIFTDHNMFTCSAGDTSLSLNEDFDLQICHRTFYMNEINYTKYANDECNRDCYDENEFLTHRFDLLRTYIAKQDDKKEIIRLLYIMNLYHENYSLFVQTVVAQIIEMAKCKQVSGVYLNLEMAKLLATFVSTQSCMPENILKSGTLYSGINYLIRIFGNGIFEEFLKRYLKEGNNGNR